VLLSVLLLLYRASRPYVAVLGRMPGPAASFGDLARHQDAEPVPRLVIVRLDAPLYFFNANVAKAEIVDIVAAQEPSPQGVLIDLAATADLDVTTTDMLFELVADLRSRSIEVLVAQVRGTVRDRLRKTGLMDELGEDRVYLSITSAVNDVGRRWQEAEAIRPDDPGEAGR
jgi:MFS superfamily sulfate permease-like transporter